MREMDPQDPVDPAQPLWRYLRVERFVELLERRTLYFAAAREFQDPFEGALYVEPPSGDAAPEMNFVESAFEQLRRLTKISCWHMADFESEAMWKLYAFERKGVALVTTAGRLSSALEPFRLDPAYGEEEPWWGRVNYIDLSRFRSHAGMLHRFYTKHLAFESERELRVVISLRMAEEFAVQVPERGIHVPLALTTLAQSVVLGPDLTEAEREQVTAACQRVGLEIRTSTLLWRPRYIDWPSVSASRVT